MVGNDADVEAALHYPGFYGINWFNVNFRVHGRCHTIESSERAIDMTVRIGGSFVEDGQHQGAC